LSVRRRDETPERSSGRFVELLPLLVHIQAHLEDDLDLTTLARHAGHSPSHLHRVFSAAVGETPRQYVSRLRLERAAFRLLVHDASILSIALDCGFDRHETFTRAFRRRFHRTPSEYRTWAQRHVIARAAVDRSPPQRSSPAREPAHPDAFALSTTTVRRLRPVHLAFVRHLGPYEAVPDTIFEALERWATRVRLRGPRIWMGIGHDAPLTTRASQRRFDAALVVPAPFAPDGRVAYQALPGGDFAVTTHAGSFDTLPAAYATIFPRVTTLRGFDLVGLPAVEIYHASAIRTRDRLPHTDICLPVRRRGVR